MSADDEQPLPPKAMPPTLRGFTTPAATGRRAAPTLRNVKAAQRGSRWLDGTARGR